MSRVHSHFYINPNFLPAEGLGQQEKGNLFLRGNMKGNFFNNVDAAVGDGRRDKDERTRANPLP